MAWFYEFKLHLTLNEQEELPGMNIMAGNVDNRDAVLRLSVPCLGDSLVTVDCFPQALFEKLCNSAYSSLPRT